MTEEIIIGAVLAAIVTVIFVLFGVRTGRRIEQQAYRQIDSSHEMGPNGRRRPDSEETARTAQNEKHRLYEAILAVNRKAISTVAPKEGAFRRPGLQVSLKQIQELEERLQDLQPKIDLAASPEVLELSAELYTALGQCWNTLYQEVEERKSERAPGSASVSNGDFEIDPNTWKIVQPIVEKWYKQQHVEELFLELRDQIRKELGYEEIEPESAPTPDKLRRELEER